MGDDENENPSIGGDMLGNEVAYLHLRRGPKQSVFKTTTTRRKKNDEMENPR